MSSDGSSWYPAGAAVIVAVLLATVSVIAGVNAIPATVGALIGAGVEFGAVGARRRGSSPIEHRVDRGTVASVDSRTRTSMPQGSRPVGPADAAGDAVGSTANRSAAPDLPPVQVLPSSLPANEVPCQACGLYAVPAPDVTSLPRPGSHRHLGPS